MLTRILVLDGRDGHHAASQAVRHEHGWKAASNLVLFETHDAGPYPSSGADGRRPAAPHGGQTGATKTIMTALSLSAGRAAPPARPARNHSPDTQRCDR